MRIYLIITIEIPKTTMINANIAFSIEYIMN